MLVGAGDRVRGTFAVALQQVSRSMPSTGSASPDQRRGRGEGIFVYGAARDGRKSCRVRGAVDPEIPAQGNRELAVGGPVRPADTLHTVHAVLHPDVQEQVGRCDEPRLAREQVPGVAGIPEEEDPGLAARGRHGVQRRA